MAHDCVTEFRPACDRCAAHDETCGVRCIDCGERLCAWFGPEPALRCTEHPTCTDCADVVTCVECRELRADMAEDRREEVAQMAWREGRG